MVKFQNKDEYMDRVADDCQVNLVLGKNLHNARMQAKTPGGEAVTFEWLSKVTTIHHVSIRRFEKAETGMTVANLVRLRDAIGCSWDDLLKGCKSDVVKVRKKYLRK